MENALRCFASCSPLDVLVRWSKKIKSYVTRLRLSQQVSYESYFLQVSHILAAVFH